MITSKIIDNNKTTKRMNPKTKKNARGLSSLSYHPLPQKMGDLKLTLNDTKGLQKVREAYTLK